MWYLQKQIKRKVAFKNKSNLSEKVAKIKFKNNYEIQEYLGKSNRINREEKEVIKRYINYMLSNVEELRKMEIAEEIGRIKKS